MLPRYKPSGIAPEQLRLFFDFCFLDLIEKIGRLEEFVTESIEQTTYRFGPQPKLVEEFRDGVAREAVSLRQRITTYLAVRSHDDLLDLHWSTLLNEIKRASETFQTDHSRLLRFPAQWVSQELYVFVDDVCRDVAWSDKEQLYDVSRLGTIVLDDIYDFGSMDRETWEKTRGGSIPRGEVREKLFLLPKAEKDNPLAWPMLIHEVGHAVVHSEAILDKARKLLLGINKEPLFQDQVPDNWVLEIAADLFALDLLGPVYLLSFLSLAMVVRTRRLTEPSHTHPPPSVRLEYMLDRLQSRQMGYGHPQMVDMSRHRDRFETRLILDLVRHGVHGC